MAFEDLRTRIALLFEEMVNQPEDAHETAAEIRELLREMRAEGLPVPDDLVELEAQIERDFGESGTESPTKG